MHIKKIVPSSIGLTLTFALTMSAPAVAVDYSNVKTIPDNFNGRWAGMHSTKKKLTQTILKDLCENGGEQDTAYFVTFDPDRQRIKSVSYWEDLDTEYPISYSKYTPNHITGQSLTLSFEMGDDDMLAAKNVGKFDYRITNGKLYVSTYDNQYIEMRRCD